MVIFDSCLAVLLLSLKELGVFLIRKIIVLTAVLVVFILGSYAEAFFRITPFVTVIVSTGKLLASDLYAMVSSFYPTKINNTAMFFALGGFLAMLSFKFLARTGKL